MAESFLEKLEREHPEFIGDHYPGGFSICPVDIGYEERTDCPFANGVQPWEEAEEADCYAAGAGRVRSERSEKNERKGPI